MIGPLRHTNVPAGTCGQLCMPNTMRIGNRSNSPSLTISAPPARPSSAGWKIT